MWWLSANLPLRKLSRRREDQTKNDAYEKQWIVSTLLQDYARARCSKVSQRKAGRSKRSLIRN